MLALFDGFRALPRERIVGTNLGKPGQQRPKPTGSLQSDKCKPFFKHRMGNGVAHPTRRVASGLFIGRQEILPADVRLTANRLERGGFEVGVIGHSQPFKTGPSSPSSISGPKVSIWNLRADCTSLSASS